MANYLTLKLLALVLTIQTEATDKCSVRLSSSCTCTSDTNHLLYIVCLYSHGNNVTRVLTADQPTPVAVHSLNISHNGLSDLPSEYFSNISSIAKMDLSFNSFITIPETLKQLTGLQELDLSYNELKELDLSSHPNLYSLYKLIVTNNNIVTLKTNGISRNGENLRKLDLTNNKITLIEPGSLSVMENLKILNLAGNQNLRQIDDVAFPKHLEAANFDSDGLQEINTCNFKSLSDLELLNLNNNQLNCSCELASLYRWVDRNRQNDELHHLEDTQLWQCTQDNGQKVNVTEMYKLCSDLDDPANCTKFRARQVDREANFERAISKFQLIKLDNEKDEINMEWTFMNSSLLFGYKVKVTKDDVAVYTSPIIHQASTFYTFTNAEITSGDFNVCIDVLRNATTIVKQECQIISVASIKVITGVLAGTVFLVPFLVILICIVKKDHTKVKQYETLAYQESVNLQQKRTPREKLESNKTPIVKVNIEQESSNSGAQNSNGIAKTLEASLDKVVVQDERNMTTNSENTTINKSTASNGQENTGYSSDERTTDEGTDQAEVIITENSHTKL